MAQTKNAASVFDGNRGRVRFSKAPWFSSIKDLQLTIIGAGGIGSWLAHFAARAGAYASVYDMDRYDINNMGGQLASVNHIRVNKSHAIARLIEYLLGVEEGEPLIFPIDEPFEKGDTLAPVTFAAVDDMEVRKEIYETWLELGDDREIFIDGRMGAEQFEIYTATKEQDNYMEHWFPPKEAAKLPCAYKATSHIGSMVASVMFGILTNHFTEDNFVPEQIVYNTQLFMFESE